MNRIEYFTRGVSKLLKHLIIQEEKTKERRFANVILITTKFDKLLFH